MNFRMIFKSLGMVLCIEALCMVPSLMISSFSRQDDTMAFIVTILILVVVGLLMNKIKTVSTNIYSRDGFAIVALGWLMVSIFGALPFVLSGAIPSFIDALFESVSGFSTTGASILNEIEGLPRGILFWRSFTIWMGGMGVLVLTLAILPSIKANTLHIMKAESPGPTPEKLVPKIKQTVKILYFIYITLTVLHIIFLLAGGMSLYDSLIHAFGTAGTGGFSNKNMSISAYNSTYIEVVITVFMLLFGVNFALYYQVFKGNFKSIYKDEELRFYFGIVAISIMLITLNINGKVFHSIWEAVRHSTFQVASVITTTGYATTDFNLWPGFSKFILLLLMFVGASAGSTAGGIKCIRLLLLLKVAKREVSKIIHPRSVYTIKIGGNMVEEETLMGILTFFFLYVAIFTVSVLVISIDGKDIITTVTSVIATIGNIGPGLGAVGPVGNFSDFSAISKVVLSLCMIFGRLEIYPLLMILTPTFWKRVNI
ncbi:MAG: Trk system potassium uptake protein TrkG [Firmicutes bacterium ADurb.Bin419]|nr:MAG: Trk system potassium uptake protein TrkG [Firmicutes bacterium ADurb.Bin419]